MEGAFLSSPILSPDNENWDVGIGLRRHCVHFLEPPVSYLVFAFLAYTPD